MPLPRRHFIRLIGGGAIAAAALPAIGCAEEPDPRAAWISPGASETDPRRRALAYALLAPNPHNMQPWMADLRQPDAIILYADPTRLLPASDPFNRQIVVGCGAFLELLSMAAAEDGLDARITPFPNGEAEPLLDARSFARVDFRKGAARDPLFIHALQRRTSRVPFDGRIVPLDIVQRTASAVHPGVAAAFTLDPTQVASLRALVFEAARVEAYTPAAQRETCERTFIGAAEIAANPYGIALEGPAIEAAHAVGLLTQAAMDKPGSWAFNQSLDFLKSLAATAAGFVWLATPANSRAEQIAAGRSYFRLNTQAAAEGLAVHPWSQSLQEYASMAPLFAQVHKRLAPGGERLQMLVRIGYAHPVKPAPRRGLAAQIRTA
jgi:hypothetical protein